MGPGQSSLAEDYLALQYHAKRSSERNAPGPTSTWRQATHTLSQRHNETVEKGVHRSRGSAKMSRAVRRNTAWLAIKSTATFSR